LPTQHALNALWPVAVLGFAVWGASGVAIFSAGVTEVNYTIAATDPGFREKGIYQVMGYEVPQKLKRFH